MLKFILILVVTFIPLPVLALSPSSIDVSDCAALGYDRPYDYVVQSIYDSQTLTYQVVVKWIASKNDDSGVVGVCSQRVLNDTDQLPLILPSGDFIQLGSDSITDDTMAVSLYVLFGMFAAFVFIVGITLFNT